LLEEVGDDVVFLRDATRGGLAGVAVDLAERSKRCVLLDEPSIPLRKEAEHAAEMLGLDPLEIANEGKVVAVVRGKAADAALNVMRSHPLGKDAAIIGSVGASGEGVCEVQTAIGGRRVLLKPYGEQLPRIC
jgi:hydrogenase expression/formation protein HypE